MFFFFPPWQEIYPQQQAAWIDVINAFYGNSFFPNVTGPQQWQDPGALSVGLPGLNADEWQTQFALWAISASPLWASADLTRMSITALQIFTNAEVIDVNQDPLGIQGTKVPVSSPSVQPGNGPYVVVSFCESASTWILNGTDFTVREETTGNCLTVANCITDAGADIIMWECVEHWIATCQNQHFLRTDTNELMPVISGLCVTAYNIIYGLRQFPCNRLQTQQWILRDDNKLQLASSDPNNPLCMSSMDNPGTGEVWAKKMVSATSGSAKYAVALFNNMMLGTPPLDITVKFTDIGFDNSAAQISARDLLQHKDLGTYDTSFTASQVPPHGVMMVVFTQVA